MTNENAILDDELGALVGKLLLGVAGESEQAALAELMQQRPELAALVDELIEAKSTWEESPMSSLSADLPNHLLPENALPRLRTRLRRSRRLLTFLATLLPLLSALAILIEGPPRSWLGLGLGIGLVLALSAWVVLRALPRAETRLALAAADPEQWQAIVTLEEGRLGPHAPLALLWGYTWRTLANTALLVSMLIAIRCMTSEAPLTAVATRAVTEDGLPMLLVGLMITYFSPWNWSGTRGRD